MESISQIAGYRYSDSELNHSHNYLLPKLTQILAARQDGLLGRRLFDLGCGNGSVTNYLAQCGYLVTGVDPSEEGIKSAKRAYPQILIEQGSAYDNLVDKYGKYNIVVSLEVVEHLYSPRRFAKTIYNLLDPGGIAVISTPYHGYWKNLALAITGKLDAHFTALWDHGHIKFWSISTLSALLQEAGFKKLEFYRVGRLSPLAKSMFVVATR